MKKLLSVSLAMLLVFAATSSMAITMTFAPDDPDLLDFNHGQYYAWHEHETFDDLDILGAVLYIDNIYNNVSETGDVLYVHLLNTPPVPASSSDFVAKWDDNPVGYVTDNFAGAGPLIDAWTDVVDGPPGHNLSYDLAALGYLDEFQAYVADGLWGFGFDPDCHFMNSGIRLEVETQRKVPEPTALILFGAALAGMGIISRRKKA